MMPIEDELDPDDDEDILDPYGEEDMYELLWFTLGAVSMLGLNVIWLLVEQRRFERG